MNERLTWGQEEYPDQWVGLAEMEYEPDNDVTIKSAVVKYIRKPRSDLARMQMQINGEVLGRLQRQVRFSNWKQGGILDETICVIFIWKTILQS